jgi:putative membrane protein
MPVLAQVFAAIAALLHVLFFVMESVLFTRPDVYRRFGIASQQEAETVRPMAYNQGFYNLALALGIVVGLVMVQRTGDAVVAGKAIVIFACACIVLAAVVLLSTGRRFLTAAFIQGLPPLLAIVLAVML